jgi:hypothetical protein
MHNALDIGRSGSHVFVGPAADSYEAIAAARAAVVGSGAGSRPDSAADRSEEGWSSAGLRLDWTLDWRNARADVWADSFERTRRELLCTDAGSDRGFDHGAELRGTEPRRFSRTGSDSPEVRPVAYVNWRAQPMSPHPEGL